VLLPQGAGDREDSGDVGLAKETWEKRPPPTPVCVDTAKLFSVNVKILRKQNVSIKHFEKEEF